MVASLKFADSIVYGVNLAIANNSKWSEWNSPVSAYLFDQFIYY